jgi:RimJ/RimL family protein N-acetyltransferase
VNLIGPAGPLPAGPVRLPTLVTGRLVLRPFDPAADLDAVAALTADASTMRYLADGKPWTREATGQMLARHVAQYPRGLGFAAVVERETGAFAGWTGIQNPRSWLPMVIDSTLPEDLVEVGWALHPGFLGRGFATEAAGAWIGYGFATLGLREIVSVHDPANVASERVMDRLGMRRRQMLPLTNGDELCLHVVTAAEWTPRK